MLHSVTIWAILINIASSITQDCFYFPDSRLECVEYIDIQKGIHGCTTLKDSVQVTGISNVIDGDKWIEIIETNEEEKNTKYVRLQNGECSNNCCDNLLRSERTFGLLLIPSLLGLQLGAELIHSIVKTDHKGHIADTTASKLQTTITTTGRALTTTEQPVTTANPCVDEPLVNCHDSDICQSPFRDSCPLSCGVCVPVTTRKPCVDNKFVQCQDQSACSSRFRQFCPESCGLCGSNIKLQVTTPKTVTTTKSPTTTGWLHVKGKR